MTAKYSFKWNKDVLARVSKNTNTDMLALAFKIASHAQRNAPKDTGALVNSIRVTDDKHNTIYVLAGGKFNGKKVPYAKMREYHNKAHPDTRFYMKNAFEWGKENYQKYFEGLTK